MTSSGIYFFKVKFSLKTLESKPHPKPEYCWFSRDLTRLWNQNLLGLPNFYGHHVEEIIQYNFSQVFIKRILLCVWNLEYWIFFLFPWVTSADCRLQKKCLSFRYLQYINSSSIEKEFFVFSSSQGKSSRFCFQVTWLTKSVHEYRKWLQPPIEETWPKTNPRILKAGSH